MEMTLSEMIDRYSILLLKKDRLPEHAAVQEECSRFAIELEIYQEQEYVREHLDLLVKVNGQIWDLESDIRRGREGELGLEEVGRRALLIRDLNAERIRLKNRVAERHGEFKEIKVDHASDTKP
jgi:hypothetical protein